MILKIINTNKQEPIKANITQNIVANTIEIRVTYTKNGIREIVDENGNKLTLKEENGVILADTGEKILGIGTYSFTVVDNKGNKQNLSITPNINSVYKVAYINGTDNMDNTATYTKTTETKTSAENTLINQLSTVDTSTTYSRAITDSNKAITAIIQQTRTDADEQMYFYGKYKVKDMKSYYAKEATTPLKKDVQVVYYIQYGYYDDCKSYSKYTINSDGKVSLSNYGGTQTTGAIRYLPDYLTIGNTKNDDVPITNLTTFYKAKVTKSTYRNGNYTSNVYMDIYKVTISYTTDYKKGDYVSDIIEKDGTYEHDKADSRNQYWYVRNSLAPKYILYKYDSNLNLQSTYDVDTRTLTTAPIDILNRGNNKVKLTLNASGADYKTYISNDNSNWQEVTDVTSGVSKEVNVDGWNNLYIKIETNTSTINNIDVAYYKD